MSRARRLARRGQRKAESLMVDACTIKPVTGETTDPVTFVVTPTYGTPVYTGKCKIQTQRLLFPGEPVAGDHRWTIIPSSIHLPLTGTASVDTGHVVTITSSVDAANVGRIFRVQSTDRKTFGTALRLMVEEVMG